MYNTTSDEVSHGEEDPRTEAGGTPARHWVARASFSGELKQSRKRWREGVKCTLAQGLSRLRQGKLGGYTAVSMC